MSLPAEQPAVPVARPAAPVRREVPNLARRPFINTRPVTRVSLLLWLFGGLLLLGNVSLFWSYLAGSGEKRTELAQAGQRIERQRQRNAELEQRLANLDLEQQNRQVRFLNRRIAQRTFSWSELFDHLAAVLPDGVRITSLTPLVIGEDDEETGRRRVEEESTERRVLLRCRGEAKSDEALYQFVDRLWTPPFSNPDFPRESLQDDGIVEFNLQVTYAPGGQPSDVVIEEEPAPPLSPALPTPGMPAPPGSQAPSTGEPEVQ